MKRLSLLAAGVLVLCAATSAFAQGFPRNGFLGIYSDAAGTVCCMTVPAFAQGTLYLIADCAGTTAGGITGAEFRITVENPAGYFFQSYAPPPGQTPTTVGSPLDTDPAPDNPAGMNIAFAECQVPVSGRVQMGSIGFFNSGGAGTDLIVTRHTPPSNLTLADCPLFTLCDAPIFTAVCMTVQTPTLPAPEEPLAFKATLNKTCAGTTCGFVGVEKTSWDAVKGLYR